MIELIALYYFVRNIGQMVEEKGYRSLWYKVLAVFLWFGGELTGGIIGAIIFGQEGGQCVIYLFALAGGLISAGTIYLIAKNLTPKSEENSFSQKFE